MALIKAMIARRDRRSFTKPEKIFPIQTPSPMDRLKMMADAHGFLTDTDLKRKTNGVDLQAWTCCLDDLRLMHQVFVELNRVMVRI